MVWVSSPKGSNKFDKDTEVFERFGREAGIISNIRGILEDDEGNLWIGSDSGLYIFGTKFERVVKHRFSQEAQPTQINPDFCKPIGPSFVLSNNNHHL